MSLRANRAKRIRLSDDLFASSKAFDVATRVLVSQPTMAVLEKEGEPSKWIHEACKKDCKDDTDGAPDNRGNERPCTCRYKYFLIFGEFFRFFFIYGKLFFYSQSQSRALHGPTTFFLLDHGSRRAKKV